MVGTQSDVALVSIRSDFYEEPPPPAGENVKSVFFRFVKSTERGGGGVSRFKAQVLRYLQGCCGCSVASLVPAGCRSGCSCGGSRCSICVKRLSSDPEKGQKGQRPTSTCRFAHTDHMTGPRLVSAHHVAFSSPALLLGPPGEPLVLHVIHFVLVSVLWTQLTDGNTDTSTEDQKCPQKE